MANPLKGLSENKLDEYIILNKFLKRVPISIAFFSMEEKLIDANQHFLYQFDLEDSNNTSFSLLHLFQYDSIDFSDSLSIDLQKNEYVSRELRYLKNGDEKWYNISIFQDYHISNKEPLYVLVAKDITKSKLALKRSQETEALLNSIYDNTIEGIFQKDQNRIIEFANPSFLKLFGYSSIQEIPNQSFDALYQNPTLALEHSRILLEEGSLKNKKILFKKKNGEIFWGLKNCRRSNSDNTSFYNGAIIDINEEIKKDTILADKNNQLMVIQDHLDRLLYSASHDLKSPITAILGLLNLMDDEFSSNTSLTEYLKMLRTCTNKLEYIVTGLNHFTMNTHQRVLSEKINLETLISEVIEALKDHKNYEMVEITKDIEAVINYPFYSDKERIQIVLNNILLNALNFIDYSKGHHHIQVLTDIHDGKIRIRIIDNGIGIPQAYVDKVFGMFYKAHLNSSSTGLGLYIAKETLLKIGGSINIKSTHKVETEVEIIIPNDPKGKLMLKKIQFKNTPQQL